ncbi:hypothetical protein JJV70_09300 [Streptomyces sp. JJ66]|uniref:hypothetical protein n=1 Tax=Streptomyces sp. JJ66 TaxID=2803843 RepID=UPI001C55CA02|nr:hypothetical protein [Streptomyces sp. JJ66]MBW1602302.1 hypothetical protein [Streptomyces sp. JJ66]
MKARGAGVVGLLVSAVVLVPSAPAVAAGSSAHPGASPGGHFGGLAEARPETEPRVSPGPSLGEPDRPPGWYPIEDFPFWPTPGPDGPPPPRGKWPVPTPSVPSPSAEPASPSPVGTPSPSASPSPSPTPTGQEQAAAQEPLAPRDAPERQGDAHRWVPLPGGPPETFGSYDLYAEYADQTEPRAEQPVAADAPTGPVLPVLSLGAGLTSLGLGLAFIALRLRRG